jgi:hypothetical protein
MPARDRRKAGKPVRPIKTKRDYEGAAGVIKGLSGRADLDSSAEIRLQSLLRELDKFDEPEDDPGDDAPEDIDYAGPKRRWSDD